MVSTNPAKSPPPAEHRPADFLLGTIISVLSGLGRTPCWVLTAKFGKLSGTSWRAFPTAYRTWPSSLISAGARELWFQALEVAGRRSSDPRVSRARETRSR